MRITPTPISHTAIAILAAFSFYACEYAEACTPKNKKTYSVRKFTNYAPVKKGTKGRSYDRMNGVCGTSASARDACDYRLEDHLAGNTKAVMGAVPQRGGTSFLFGGKYRADALEKALGKVSPYGCIQVIAGDKYNTKSNDKSKMDIVTRDARSALTSRVNRARGNLRPIGRLESRYLKPASKIPEAKRNPGAVSPVRSPAGRCRTIKVCRKNNKRFTGASCNRVAPRWVCFEKEDGCNSGNSCFEKIR